MRYACGVAAMALIGLLPAPCHATSLEEEMRGLVESHPQIQSKTKAVNSAEEDIRSARAGFLPTAKLGGDHGYEYIDSPDRRLTQGKPYSNNRASSNLTVTQKIFDGFATDAGVDAAKANHSAQEANLRATRQTTLLEGATAYLDILRYTKLVALARESQRKVTEQLNLEDERVEKGSGIASDVLAAKQRLQIAKDRRVRFEGGFQGAVARYTQVYGHAPDVSSLSEPPLPLDMIPETIEDSLDVAEKDNPSLQSATKTISVNDERRRIAEAGYWPTLDLVGKADYENGKSGVIGPRRDWSMLLVASWELFSGFKTDALVAAASWNHAASKDDRLHTSRKVSEAVRTAWHDLDTARQRLELLDTGATLAEEVWEAQKKKQVAGKATTQEVLDDENKILEARSLYTEAYYDMYNAAYKLLSAMGRLEVDNLTRPPLPGQGNAAPLPPARSMELTRPMAKASTPVAPMSAPRAVPALAKTAPATPAYPVEASKAGPGQADTANTAMAERVRSLMAAKDEFWTVR